LEAKEVRSEEADVSGLELEEREEGCRVQARGVGHIVYWNSGGYIRAAWCLLFVLIRQGLRGGSGPQLHILGRDILFIGIKYAV
jgi:hypothetical protein